jgi:ankyrin repeat protein
MQQRGDQETAASIYESALAVTQRHGLNRFKLFDVMAGKPPPLDKHTPAEWSILHNDLKSFIAVSGGVQPALGFASDEAPRWIGALAAAGADINRPVASNARTVLMQQVEKGCVEGVCTTLQADGVALGVRDDDGRTALALAVVSGQPGALGILEQLLAAGCNPRQADLQKETLIEAAAKRAAPPVLRRFLEALQPLTSADLIALESWTHTIPYWKGTGSRQSEVLIVLLDFGISMEIRQNSPNRSPLLFCAAMFGDMALVSALVRKGAHLDAVNNNKCSAVTAAAIKGHHEIVKFLQEKGANMQLRDEQGRCAADYLR